MRKGRRDRKINKVREDYEARRHEPKVKDPERAEFQKEISELEREVNTLRGENRHLKEEITVLDKAW